MTHNIIGNEVGRPFIGGPNTGSIKRSNRAWIHIVQGAAVGAFVVMALGICALIG